MSATRNASRWGGRYSRWAWLAAAALVYLALAAYQLNLPGLHYDEAKEAGVPALDLLNGAVGAPFRGVTLRVGAWDLPVMVQDYIGAVNVYLALPFLALTGVGVPNLRALSVLTGLAALILAALTVSTWHGKPDESTDTPLPRLTWAGVAVAWLLAASPSFVFWSRQGLFVTNLIQPLAWICLWQGTRWWLTGRPAALVIAAAAGGLALYAKLLAVWVIGPWLLGLALLWLWRRNEPTAPRLSPQLLIAVGVAFVVPLLPLLYFNLQTQGTFSTLWRNAWHSYYGVNNLALWDNAQVRWGQLWTALRGDQFWYLGGLYANPLAPWLVALSVAAGFASAPRRMMPVVGVTAAAWLASLVTISDLFITHYALLQPLVVAAAALGLVLWANGEASRRVLAAAVVATWVLLDGRAAWLYHGALARSGGLAAHSDASYELAAYLQANGLDAPIALDWGMDATVRFLSAGAVRPIEIFGYASPAAPDADFTARLAPFLENPDNVYLLHATGSTVFEGRREAFLLAAAARDRPARLVRDFAQRDGTPLYEIWRALPP